MEVKETLLYSFFGKTQKERELFKKIIEFLKKHEYVDFKVVVVKGYYWHWKSKGEIPDDLAKKIFLEEEEDQ